MPDETTPSQRLVLSVFQLVSDCNWQPYYESEDDLFDDVKTHFEALLVVFAAADGVLSEDEVDHIREYMNLDEERFSFEMLQDYIESKVESANRYISAPPKYFRMVVAHDRNQSSRVSASILAFARLFAFQMANADGDFSEEERDLLTSVFAPYIALMEKSGIKIEDDESDDADTNESADDSLESSPETRRQLTDLLEELHSLVGLEAVKNEVSSTINLIKVRKLREQNGIKSPPMSLHMVFSGNPGTGKTTVARLVAEIYRELGVLEKGHLVEVDRSGLVAGYVGQTALRVREVCKKALGGVLFIDEAYTLAKSGEQDFGSEAIDTLLKFMEDNRSNIIIIAAGYSQKMQHFLDSNPGLQSRFNKHVQFADYAEEDLFDIFLAIAREHGYAFDHIFARRLKELLATVIKNKQQNFGNGRVVRNLFERVVENHSNRVAQITSPTKIQLTAFTAEDLDGVRITAN